MVLDYKYENKILIFFDVLGFKEMVQKKYLNKPEKIKEILTTMHVLATGSYKSDLIVFSDSVVNIIDRNPKYSEHGQTFSTYLNIILNDIATIQLNMFTLHGVLIRGSIVMGDIVYERENNLLFGPALIDAYELESKYSIYPRFLLGHSIISQLDNLNVLEISKDMDGHYYVDVFKWLVKLEREKQQLVELKRKIDVEIKNLGSTPNLGVLSKYNWFLNKIIEREKCDFKKRT
ncbi:hypothetical protein [Exiguobacterium sp. ERU656]|uniref:hypothetical protein n=1 Tax=Exiguobacterium sp. ERU656 TaxID=2751217 RepID=UPI001BE5DD28|nr:hypothetical protein [Exiguobacterium sp. ERU656]